VARWLAGKHSNAASYGGVRLAWGPGERGQGRRGLCWRGGAGAVALARVNSGGAARQEHGGARLASCGGGGKD